MNDQPALHLARMVKEQGGLDPTDPTDAGYIVDDLVSGGVPAEVARDLARRLAAEYEEDQS